MSDNLIPDNTKVRCRAVRGGLLASSKKNVPYLEIECEPVDGPFKGWTEPLVYKHFLQETNPADPSKRKSLAQVIQAAVEAATTAGWDGSDPDRMENGYGEAEFIAVIGIDKGTQKEDGSFYPDRNRVKFINEPQASGGVELDNVARASLGAQIRAARLSMKRPGPAKASAAAPAVANGAGRGRPPF